MLGQLDKTPLQYMPELILDARIKGGISQDKDEGPQPRLVFEQALEPGGKGSAERVGGLKRIWHHRNCKLGFYLKLKRRLRSC